MVLSDEQKQLMRNTLDIVHALNNCLEALRNSGIACNIRDDTPYKSRWMLDAKAIITREHYGE